jgi:two-component system LytT family response regulator
MIRTVIVDDEPRSIRSLELLLEEHCPDVQVVERSTNALQAVKAILDHRPDLVFLDVHMPAFSGFDVLESVNGVPRAIVFTTAHRKYAITALRKGAFDYLLKPLDWEELKSCVERVKATIHAGQPGQSTIELSVKDGIIFIRQADLVRVEAAGSYTTFILENNVRHVASKSMKEFEAQLDGGVFFRCHNSHIINLRKVSKFVNTNGYFAVLTNGDTVEIARRQKDAFLERLKELQ